MKAKHMSPLTRLKPMVAALLFTLVSLAVCPATLGASTEREAEGEHGERYEFHPNLLAAFVGVAVDDRRDNGLALGIEYEKRFSETFGVGGVAEYTFGDFDVWVFAVPFAYHMDRWKFYVAPGIEDSDHHGNEFLMRFGVEYGFEAGSWEVSPQLDVDIVDGDQVLVLGVAFGRGF